MVERIKKHNDVSFVEISKMYAMWDVVFLLEQSHLTEYINYNNTAIIDQCGRRYVPVEGFDRQLGAIRVYLGAHT